MRGVFAGGSHYLILLDYRDVICFTFDSLMESHSCFCICMSSTWHLYRKKGWEFGSGCLLEGWFALHTKKLWY